MDYIIRNEKKSDYEKVEEITRKAFWNVFVPGCDEHYLVHVMRQHPDFVSELDFVIEKDNTVIGSILYTKAKLIDEQGNEKSILSFGPVCILPEYQKCGYGKKLIEFSFEKAKELSFDTVVIFGNPDYYVRYGFKSCKRYSICLEDNVYPSAMLVKELKEGCLDRRKWYYKESSVFSIDSSLAEQFDSGFEKMEKCVTPNQEVFYILSQSTIR